MLRQDLDLKQLTDKRKCEERGRTSVDEGEVQERRKVGGRRGIRPVNAPPPRSLAFNSEYATEKNGAQGEEGKNGIALAAMQRERGPLRFPKTQEENLIKEKGGLK